MGGILGKALAGGAGALKESSFEIMRAEITAQRDARLNEYARNFEMEIKQPGQEKLQKGQQDFQSGEGVKTREHDSAKHGATLGETKRHNIAMEGIGMKGAEAKVDKKDGGITHKDGLKVLEQHFGGHFEGGMWFPDEKNRDVGLRSKQLFEQFVSGPNALAPMEAATKAAQQAEREKAMGNLPIGQGAAPPASDAQTDKPGQKNFRNLWGGK